MASYVPKDSIGLMGLYFPYGSPTSQILMKMRRAIFSGQNEGIPYSEVKAAQAEIANARQRIDESTPEFAQDINGLVFGNEPKDDPIRAIILVKGDFIGKNEGIENAIIANDLGTNPWPLYQGREGYDTIDTRLTKEQTERYLRQYVEDLRRKEIGRFFVRESSFVYVRDRDLERNGFKGASGINFQDLAPYLVDTYGFVGLERVSKPAEEDYKERAVPFMAYRQKASLLEKIIRKLCERNPFTHEGDVIADWGAHRICLEKEKDAIYWGNIFQGRAEVGRFVTRGLHTDDYYAEPKDNGFKAFNITARVSKTTKNGDRKPKKDRDVVREIQIYDLMSHFNFQINESHPANHRGFRRSQTDSQKKRRALMRDFEYDVALEFMFGAKKLEVPLPN